MSNINVCTGFQLASSKTVNWQIKMFPVVFKSPELIKSQMIKLEVDGAHDIPRSRWNLYMDWNPDRGIIVSIDADMAWRSHTDACSEIPVFYRARGSYVWPPSKTSLTHSTPMMTSKFFGKAKMEAKSTTPAEIMCLAKDILGLAITNTNENLNINVSVEVYRKLTQNEDAFIGKFMKESSDSLRGHMLQLLTSAEFSDMKIVSNDEMEFNVHRNILAARNDVFKAMFRNNMSEATSRVVKLPDLSSAAVNFMLRFVYCSEILPFTVNGERKEGTANDSFNSIAAIEEVVYIASKYGFKDLMEYIEEKLMTFCSLQNALCLLKLCKTYSMKGENKVKAFILSNPDVIKEALDLESFP